MYDDFVPNKLNKRYLFIVIDWRYWM